MKRRNSTPLLRSFWVVSLLAILITGVTFAALQSSGVSLTGNTIKSGSASLAISKDNSGFPQTLTGFTFDNVVPGGTDAPAGGYSVYLKNTGTVNLAIKASIGPVAPSNLNNVDLTKVFLHVVRTDNAFNQSFSLKSLIDSYTTGGVSLGDSINAGVTAQYKLSISMNSDAFAGSSATISGVDMVFSGTGI